MEAGAIRSVVRTLVHPREFGELDFDLYERGGDYQMILRTRDTGPKMRAWYRRISAQKIDSFAGRGRDELFEWLIGEVRALIAESKRVHGLVVGRAGKWRLYSRKAA